MRKGLWLFGFLLLTLVITSAALAQEDGLALTILHTNDTHAAHQPNSDGNGGVARQATVVNQVRAESENVLLVDAGDRFTGSLFHQQYRGQDQVQLMNALGYDVMTLGNHEFDDGEDVLLEFVNGLEFPVVGANIDFGPFEDLTARILPYVILDVGGQQVGVIGMVTPDTTITSSPSDEVSFNADMVGVVAEAVSALSLADVNKIILLTHTGIEVDQELLTQLSGVDIVIGGHSHTLLSNTYAAAQFAYPITAETLAGEPIVYAQAGSNNVYLGHLEVEFDAAGLVAAAGGDTILLSRFITPDPTVAGIVETLAAPIEELKQTPVGETNVFLVGDRAVCRVGECNLGNFVTDAMRAETGAQIAITNGGGIRSNVPVGAETPADVALPEPLQVTLGDVLTVFPFGNLVSTFSLTGADVVVALENGVSLVEEGAGRFPQVSGIRYSWDGSKPAGSRIVSVEVLGTDGAYTPIDPAATYTLVSNDFMRRGGDGYEVFATNAIDAYDFGKPLDQVLQEYIAANSPIAPMVEGRITRVDAQ
jgi:5'-nucleotidase